MFVKSYSEITKVKLVLVVELIFLFMILMVYLLIKKFFFIFFPGNNPEIFLNFRLNTFFRFQKLKWEKKKKRIDSINGRKGILYLR
jgi:hypothetical protein